MADDTEYMLTTVDNPFDPFTQWDDWYAWDARAGYHTPGALARQAITSNELSPLDQRQAINDAIDVIVSDNFLGVYKKVVRISKTN